MADCGHRGCIGRRQCRSAQKKAHYEANLEQISARQKAYREANREKDLARKRAYYAANGEKVRAGQRAYYRSLSGQMTQIRRNRKAIRERIERKTDQIRELAAQLGLTLEEIPA